MAESKREKIERLKREAEEKAIAQQEAMKEVATQTDTSDPTDELLKEAEKAANESAKEEEKNIEKVETIEADANSKESVYKTVTAEPEKDTQPPVIVSPTSAVMVPEPKNEEYVRIKVTGLIKNETKSIRKQILVKPSVMAKVEEVLKTQYQGLSFNNLLNQLLEGWLAEMDAVEVENTEK